jgi:IS30 family transposase
LPAQFKALLRDLAGHWQQLRRHFDACDAHIEVHARARVSGVCGGDLWKHLRRRKRRRHHRCGTPRQRQRFRGRRIEEHPPGVDTRWRVGDWEGDTIVGQGTARLVTLVERKSGLIRIRRVPNGEAQDCHARRHRRLAPAGRARAHAHVG